MDFLSQTDVASASGKILNDNIHGHIHIPDVVMKYVDTPQFQRLRDLKQLGTTYYVFPSACHHRFEHCIGVSYLAGSLVDRFRRMQPELQITDQQCANVRIAGLCHDLGHGPYSHMFDNELVPVLRPDLKDSYSHEAMSLKMLNYLIDENNIDIEKDDTRYIEALIMASGATKQYRNGVPKKYKDTAFLFEIVANGRNSIDVDKFDYIQRDARATGMPVGFDHTRLMHMSRVIDNQICFNSKEALNVHQLFHTRYQLFRQVYTHKAAKSIEYMIRDAIMLADVVWNGRIKNSVGDVKVFQKLTDCILKEIEASTDPRMKEAQAIIKRIQTRDLYAFVDEHIFQDSKRAYKIKAEEIASHTQSNVKIQPGDIIVHNFAMNWCNKQKDPLRKVKFFHKIDQDSCVHLPSERVGSLLPRAFEERIVRVFTKSRDEEVVRAVGVAFRKILRERSGPIVSPTPHRRSVIYHASPNLAPEQFDPKELPVKLELPKVTSVILALAYNAACALTIDRLDAHSPRTAATTHAKVEARKNLNRSRQ